MKDLSRKEALEKIKKFFGEEEINSENKKIVAIGARFLDVNKFLVIDKLTPC